MRMSSPYDFSYFELIDIGLKVKKVNGTYIWIDTLWAYRNARRKEIVMDINFSDYTNEFPLNERQLEDYMADQL